MRKEDFVNEYMQVRQASIKPSTIISAFRKSGIWPIDRTVFGDDDYAPSIPYSTEARGVPSLQSDANDSDSGSDSELDSSYDTDTESHPVASHQPSQPTPRSFPPSSVAGNATSPSPVVGSGRAESHPLIPTQFYHDPVLFDRICQLEMQVERLSGHVKMVELELQNEKRKANQRDGRASKRRKLNVEARVLTSAEGKRLAAEKEAERVTKMQKRKEAELLRKEKEAERDQQRRDRGPDAPFIGSLSSKNKPDLQEIAAALDLSEDGTKDALMQRITTHFDSNPLLRDGPRFSGLFHRAPRRRPQATENTPSHNTSIRNPLATDLVNLPDASALAFYYNTVPTYHGQVNNNPLFHYPAGPSSSTIPLHWQYPAPHG